MNRHIAHFCTAIVLLIVIAAVLQSCAGVPDIPAAVDTQQIQTPVKTVSLIFSGDLMAHYDNFRQTSYDSQYAAIAPLLHAHNAAFTNLEFVIDNTRNYETYPRFNARTPYVQAAIDAGFSVFSLANNHTTDWYKDGVIQTKIAVEQLQQKSNNNTALIFSGLKEPDQDTFIPEVFTINDIKIAYIAVTEILNDHNEGRKYVNTVSYTQSGREDFLSAVKAIKTQYTPDILILSIHVQEPEYVRTVSKTRTSYFTALADAGADIIWANHPHVPLPWEQYTTKDDRESLIMYSLGNVMSGQRYTPNISNPAAPREYTGDAILMSVTVTQSNTEPAVHTITYTPHVFTTYVDSHTETIALKPFTDDFISTCSPQLQTYYTARLQLLRTYLPLP